MPRSVSLTLNNLYRIEASALRVKVTSLVTGVVMAKYGATATETPADAFHKVPDRVRDAALQAWGLCSKTPTDEVPEPEVTPASEKKPKGPMQYRIVWTFGDAAGCNFEYATTPERARAQFLKRRPGLTVEVVRLEVKP